MTETNNTAHPGQGEAGAIRRAFSPQQNGLPGPPAEQPTYGQVRYGDDHGPMDSVRLPAGPGSGLSGPPQADAGAVKPLWAEKDAPSPTKHTPDRP